MYDTIVKSAEQDILLLLLCRRNVQSKCSTCTINGRSCHHLHRFRYVIYSYIVYSLFNSSIICIYDYHSSRYRTIAFSFYSKLLEQFQLLYNHCLISHGSYRQCCQCCRYLILLLLSQFHHNQMTDDHNRKVCLGKIVGC